MSHKAKGLEIDELLRDCARLFPKETDSSTTYSRKIKTKEVKDKGTDEIEELLKDCASLFSKETEFSSTTYSKKIKTSVVKKAKKDKKVDEIEELLKDCASLFSKETKSNLPSNKEKEDEKLSDFVEQKTARLDVQKKIGRYILLSKIGQGGMGKVYRAHDSLLAREVALKILSVDDEIALKRFSREAKSNARLRHPHVVSLYDFQIIEGKHILVMEFIDGCSLDQWLVKQKPSFAVVCKFMLEILEGVGYAHRHKIVHRDLKPANILLDKEQNIFITDFGLAKSLAAQTKISHTGAILGTPNYMSPEQAQGMPADIQSDIYSLGIILYEMLAGRRPYLGNNAFKILYQILNEDCPSPRSINPAIPIELEQICLQALKKHKEERYATTKQMATDIKQYLQKLPTDKAATPKTTKTISKTTKTISKTAKTAPKIISSKLKNNISIFSLSISCFLFLVSILMLLLNKKETHIQIDQKVQKSTPAKTKKQVTKNSKEKKVAKKNQKDQKKVRKRKKSRKFGRHMWRELDSNRDNFISKKEWGKNDLFLFHVLDKNGDLRIAPREFKQRFQLRKKMRELQELKRWWQRMDPNNDYKITKNEWSGDKIYFYKLDKNRDGKITFWESSLLRRKR